MVGRWPRRSQGPCPPVGNATFPTSPSLPGRISGLPPSAPKREAHATHAVCLLAKFLSGPFSPVFCSKRKSAWLVGEESRSQCFQTWPELLARFLLGGLVGFHGLPGAMRSGRATSLSRGLRNCHVSPLPRRPPRVFSSQTKLPWALESCGAPT